MALVRNLFYISLAALALSIVVGVAQNDSSRLLQYTTNDQRTATVEDLCSSFESRDDLVDDAAEEENKAY